MKSCCRKGCHYGTDVLCTTSVIRNYHDDINITCLLLNRCSFRCPWWCSAFTCHSVRAACCNSGLSSRSFHRSLLLHCSLTTVNPPAAVTATCSTVSRCLCDCFNNTKICSLLISL